MDSEKEAIEKWPCLKQGKWSWDKNNKEASCRSVYKDFFEGWWHSFVPEMLDKVETILTTSNIHSYFFFGEVREKYGSMRVHFFFEDIPEEIISPIQLKTVKDELHGIFGYYTSMSYEVCANCGCSAAVCTYPWEGYYCDKCKPKLDGRNICEYRSLEDNALHIRSGRKY